MYLTCEPLVHLTTHAQARMRQRGYCHHDIRLVRLYGTPVRDGFLLTRKDVEHSRSEAGNDVQRLAQLADTLVVEIEGAVRTVYRAGKRKQRYQMAS